MTPSAFIDFTSFEEDDDDEKAAIQKEAARMLTLKIYLKCSVSQMKQIRSFRAVMHSE